MRPSIMRSVFSCVFATAGLLVAGYTQAADFFIRHQGTVGASKIAGISAGMPYAITIVLNNDHTVVNSQTWNRYHVQCVLVQTPTAGFAQPLNNGPLPTPDGSGDVITDATGVLTGMFASVAASATGVGNSEHQHVGLGSLTAPLTWTGDGSSAVLADDAGHSFTDAADGVPMAPTQWSIPQPYSDDCTASRLPVQPPAAVPTLGEGGHGCSRVSLCLGLLSISALPERACSYQKQSK